MIILDGIAGLATRYRGFVLDIWGVVHDGRAIFPGVVAALAALRARGARIVFLTNAPRRAAVIEEQLAGFGVGRDLYDAVVSSGETTWALLRERAAPGAHPFVRDLGPRATRIGPARDLLGLGELGFDAEAAPDAADWVLNLGPDPALGADSVAPYEPLLERLLARDLPMICVNPDRAVIARGRRLICAGALSEWYAARGGRTLEVGKPLPLAYAVALELLGLPLAEVVAIGDSPHTDLAGAAAVGLDAVWALGGLAAEAGFDRAEPATLAAVAEREGVRPVAALRGLRW